MKPQKLSIDVLKEDPRNARKIDDGALQGLAVSIETFGDLSSIVYNTRTGHLVAGHQRMKTLRSAGAKTWTRVSDAEGEIVHPKSKEKFRIRIVDWDETTERLANISANNTEIQGEFVDEDLALQLRELETEAQFEALRLNDLMATVVRTRRRATLPKMQHPAGFRMPSRSSSNARTKPSSANSSSAGPPRASTCEL